MAITNEDKTTAGAFEDADHSASSSYSTLTTFRPKCKVHLKVDRQASLRYLGYTQQTLDQTLIDRLEKLACQCENELEPTFIWRIVPIDQAKSQWNEDDPRVVLKHTELQLPGKDITHHLEGATFVALMACTLGMKSERELRLLSSTNALDALVWGSCANALIEATAEEAQKDIANEVTTNGLYARMRFSPGYGDLPLSVQPLFLKTIQAQRNLGLTLNESNLLIPTKSITAIVGIFDKQVASRQAKPCHTCLAHDYCSYLEKGITCYGNTNQ